MWYKYGTREGSFWIFDSPKSIASWSLVSGATVLLVNYVSNLTVVDAFVHNLVLGPDDDPRRC